jgi:predicted nucleotidyltransferase
MGTEDRTQIRRFALSQIFHRTEEVRSAYLFGSVAEGVSNPRSDLDIAVRLEPELGAEEKHRIRMDLIAELEDLHERQVDVVVLNDASLKMIYQVFNHGKSVYIRRLEEEENFRLKKQKEYFDFQYYLEKERRDLRAFYGC